MRRLHSNFTVLVRFFLGWWGGITAAFSVWLSFISWEDMGITSRFIRIVILLGVVVIASIAAIITVLLRNKKQVFGDINRGVVLCYGDVIKLGFPKRQKEKRIVVIPVNRCFDLSCEHGLISRKSIHGQWINRFIKSEEEREQVQCKINRLLTQENAPYEMLTSEDKKVGNLKRYRGGTVVELKGEQGVTFFLLALSSFDKDLKAHCTESEFFETLQGLVNYYDSHEQTEDMYCPVMGDHIVRPTHDTLDIVSLMLSVFKFNKNRIHGKLHLVVYEKMKSDVPILDH